jgi:pimeloyl-ACP methyl ester carboxylesterase
MKLNYKMFGEGKPILILHGIFGMLDNWQHIAKILSNDYWVTTIDLRNHGKSPHSDYFNYKEMTSDILEFLEDHQIKQPNIIGHSMGGKIVMHIALEYPDFINKAIIVDIGIKKYSRKHDLIFKTLCSLNLSKHNNRNSIAKELESSIPDWNIRQFLMKNINRNKERKGFTWKMNLNVIRKNYDTINSELVSEYIYDREILFIKGKKSDFIPDTDHLEIKTLFPKALFQNITKDGHWLHAEQPENLISLVKTFIN